MVELVIIVLLCFMAPIALFCLFWKLKKPFWCIALYLPLLLYSVIKYIFVGSHEGFWHSIEHFIHSDAVIIFYFWWLPSIVGYVLINIIYFIVNRAKR